MSLNHAAHKISAEDYLQGEMLAEFKHEYIDGEVYAMVGARELRSQLKGQGQHDFSSIGKGAHGTPLYIKYFSKTQDYVTQKNL